MHNSPLVGLGGTGETKKRKQENCITLKVCHCGYHFRAPLLPYMIVKDGKLGHRRAPNLLLVRESQSFFLCGVNMKILGPGTFVFNI